MWCNNAEFGLNLSWEILKLLWYTKGINNARWCIFNRSIQSNGVYSNFDTPQQPYLPDIPCLVLTAYLKWNLTGSGYMDRNILFLHKARILHHNTTMVQSQIDKSSQKSPQKLPKKVKKSVPHRCSTQWTKVIHKNARTQSSTGDKLTRSEFVHLVPELNW